jgi:hypothetical protein
MAKTKKTSARSQVIRDRRKNSKKPSKTAPTGRETTSRGQPPVMVRGGGYTPSQTRKPKRKSKNVKRRFDVALATPGVEIRLPSVPAMRLGWRLVSFVMVVGLLVLLSHLLRSPLYRVQMVDIQGAIRLTSEDINRALNIYNLSVFDLNPQKLEETLQIAFPELKQVSLQVGLPADVVVTVDERLPLINWIQDSKVQWVDAEGFAFAPRGDAESMVSVEAHASPPVPIQIDGDDTTVESFIAPKAFMPSSLVAAVLTLGPQVPEGQTIVYDSRHGLGWNDARGWDVYFGMDVADLEEKLLVYSAIIDELQTNGITPALINVEHVHAPFYRMER